MLLVFLFFFTTTLAQFDLPGLKYNLTIIDSPVDQIVWCGASVVVTNDDETVLQVNDAFHFIFKEDNENARHRKVVFVLSQHGLLYRSTDYGFKWQNVTEKLISDFQQNLHYRTFEMIQSPADSKIIFFIGTNGSSFKTDTCGMHFQRVDHNPKYFNFRLNKMDSKLLFAFLEKPCNRTDRLCRDKYKKEIHLSEDYGRNWRVILNRVREASWDKLLQYQVVPDNRILVSHLAENGSFLVSYSDDFFKKATVVRWFAFGYYQTAQYLFLLIKADSESVGYDLEVSPAVLDATMPKEIIFPVDDQTKFTFTVLDTQEGQIYLSVSHDEDLPKITNVYMSDAVGQDYTLALIGNVRSVDNGNCDYERIQAMEGVYIANVYDSTELLKFQQRKKMTTSEADRKKSQPQFDRLDAYKKTVISYNKGSTWHQLKAPKYDYSAQPLKCSGDCSLHLRGRTDKAHNPIYSSESSLGIILATGNTGLYLSQKEEELNTYFSRDGGHTWFEILKGSYIYEIGDHGGLILFAQDDRPTNHILYTWDEGLNIEKLQFTQNFKIEVDNIVTEPSNMEQKFLLIGRQDSNVINPDSTEKSAMRGVLVSIDLASIHQRVCTGQWDPTNPESDYEYWVPINFIGDKCLFGKKYKYLRRKRNAKCFNPEDTEKKIFIENCPCTESDWECDYGYQRKIEGGECIPIKNNFENQRAQKPPKNCKGTYLQSRGYRKIPGDQCEGGVYLGPIQVDCPDQEEKPQVTQNKGMGEAKMPSQNEEATKAQKPQINKVKEETFKQDLNKNDFRTSVPTKSNDKFQLPKKEVNFYEQYKYGLLLLAILVVIWLYKDQLKSFIQSKKQPQQKKKQYYPKSEEELQQKGYEKVSLFKNEEDEEAGL